MGENVIRQDIVQVDFEIEGLKELTKIKDEIDDLKKKLGAGVGDDAFDDLKDGAEEAKKSTKKLTEQAEKLKGKLNEIGKKAATTAFNGLKKLASISFKALISGIGAAATAIGVLVGKSVNLAGELEQNLGGSEAVFGKYASNMQKTAKEAYSKMGLSQSDYLATANKMGSLFQGAGFDQKKAMDMSTAAMQRAADVASIMGLDVNFAMESIAGAAKGNFTMMDNLGVAMNDTTLQAYAQEKGLGKLKTTQDKVNVAMQMFLDKTKQYDGNYEKENATYAGALTTLKASWQNTLSAMTTGGEDFDKQINGLVKSAVNFGKVLIPSIKGALSGAGKLVSELIPYISKELPSLAEELLPPLIEAAVELTKGLIKALPSLIKTIAKTIVDIFGKQFPIIGKIFDFFKDNATKVANAIKIIIPAVIGLAAAFKLFKGIQAISSLFGGLGKGRSSKGGIFGVFKKLAKTKTSTVLKGMANLAIILAGFVALSAVLMLVVPLITKLGGLGSFLQLVLMIGVLGVVGMALAKFGEIAGKIPVATVAKGLANMAIMLAGMTALLLLVGAVSLIPFDLARVLQISLIIGVLGIIGMALALFGAIVGLIPVAIVALGLANMSIMLAGMSALFLLVGAVSLIPFDLARVMQITLIIGVLGTIGTALSIFSAIVGLIPIPTVLLGLANMAIVFAGMSALLLAVSALTNMNFDVAKMLQVVMLIGVIGAVGSALSAFAAIIGLIPIPVVLLGIANMALVLTGVADLGTKLSEFASNTEGFFTKVASFPQEGFDKAGMLFNCLAGLKSLPKDGGVVGWFSGDINYGNIAKGLGELASDGVQNFFAMVTSLDQKAFDNATALFKCLAGMGNLTSGDSFWERLKDGIFGDDNGKTQLQTIAEGLGDFTEKATPFFTQVNSLNLDNMNGLWKSLERAGELTTKNLSGVVGDSIDAIVKKISELPQKMGDALKNNSKNLSDGFIAMWKDAVKASVAPVNKLLSGANHLLQQFGSKKKLIEWQPYAKGTDGHKGGNALVNDGRGAELIQMPNGRMFIPNGRNVFLPNAPKGMKVLSADNTAQLFGRKSPTFHYADGIGDLDVWSYYDNSKGLVDKLTGSISYDGMSGFASSLGKSMVSTFASEMPAWIDKLFEESGQSINSYVASKGVMQWLPTVVRALKMEGQYTVANVARTLFQMKTESGGNPRAINLWDSNAKKGIPSKGLMQVIDPTFKAYAREGFDKNIYDPLSNILASVRYATSRYGSLSKAYRGVGYSKGVGTVTMPDQTSSINLSYTPENSYTGGKADVVEYNTYSPTFNFTISGTGDDRAMARKVKRWVAEAWHEILDDYDSKTPATQQV